MEAPNAQDKYAMDQPHMENDSMYDDGNNADKTSFDEEHPPEDSNKDDSSSETAAAELLVRQERAKMTAATGSRLEAVLEQIKGATKKLLTEVDVYMDTAESVTIDYIRCQHSQRKEATRLEEVEPDVAGATARLFQQVQDEIAAGTHHDDEGKSNTTGMA